MIIQMAEVNKIGESLGIVLTGARYLLAEKAALRLKNDKPIFMDMAVLMAADVLDGVILRQFDLDTPKRRIADGFVDHASVARLMYELSKKNEAAKPYIAILAARAVAMGLLNTEHYRQTGEVTKGQMNQKATNLAMAAFGLIGTTGNRTMTHIAGGVASGIAIGTVFAHTKDLGKTHPEGIRKL
jgi:hypothetical protein